MEDVNVKPWRKGIVLHNIRLTVGADTEDGEPPLFSLWNNNEDGIQIAPTNKSETAMLSRKKFLVWWNFRARIMVTMTIVFDTTQTDNTIAYKTMLYVWKASTVSAFKPAPRNVSWAITLKTVVLFWLFLIYMISFTFIFRIMVFVITGLICKVYLHFYGLLLSLYIDLVSEYTMLFYYLYLLFFFFIYIFLIALLLLFSFSLILHFTQ